MRCAIEGFGAIENAETLQSGRRYAMAAAYPASLELRKIYEVLTDSAAEKRDQIRVIDESGEYYLYPASSFIRIQLPKNVEDAITKAA